MRMSIVYAIKIFGALSVVAWLTRLIAGPGLRAVLSPADWKAVWWGIVGTLAVSCFSVKIPLFFVVLPLWAMLLAHRLGADGSGRLPAYALLCCICPAMTFQIEHIGPLNNLILITPFRVLVAVLLVPEASRLMSRRDAPKSPSWLTLCDVAVTVYILYWLGRYFSTATITTIAREIMGQALDTVIPYFVLSRACVATAVRRRVLAFALVGAVYEAFVGMVESGSGHYLYAQLQWLYDESWGQSTGLMRGSWLRAEAAFQGPLALAVLLLFGVGLWFALRPSAKNRAYLVSVVALMGGALATYGRGPIIATFLLLASMAMLRRMDAKRYLVVATVGTVVFSVVWNTGLGDVVLGLVTRVSAGDENADFNVLYRQQLLDTSLALLRQSPWWGVPNYLDYMEDLRQGDGIIDMVNTYLIVALNSGVFGLALYLAPFVVVIWKEGARVTRRLDLRREGAAWLALTAGLLAAIFTVSPISIIQPLLVWVVALALARLQDSADVAPALATTEPAVALRRGSIFRA
jgi:hypothetical protein